MLKTQVNARSSTPKVAWIDGNAGPMMAMSSAAINTPTKSSAKILLRIFSLPPALGCR